MSAGDGRNGSRPPDQTGGGFSGAVAYLRYPAFTWPWFFRRGLIFWPIALLLGSSFGAWHAASMATWHEFWPLAWRAMLADLVVMTAGPLLATLVRQASIPYAVERVLVTAAIVAGVLIAHSAVGWSIDYHEFLMGHVEMGAQSRAALDVNRVLAKVLAEGPNWIVLALWGGGLELIAYFSERRRLELVAARRERDEADTRLAVLQAQIEPHFLFNTLASVRSLVRTDPEQAAATIDALSSYLRTTLPKLRDEAGASTLGEQLDIVTGYLDLMAIRMGGRLRFYIEVAANRRAVAFPPLILLTLVENAVKHGIEPKAGPGTIVIRARDDGASLTVEVEDDGAGLSEGGGAGVGLVNIRAQLQSRFGGEARFSLTGAPGSGALATVVVPVEAA